MMVAELREALKDYPEEARVFFNDDDFEISLEVNFVKSDFDGDAVLSYD